MDLPGPWWLQNLILRHIYKKSFFPFFPAVSSASAFKFFYFKMQYVLKNAEFGADFGSVEKVTEKLMRKKLSMKMWQKIWVFYFYYCVQKDSAYNIFGWLDLHYPGLGGSILSKKSKLFYPDVYGFLPGLGSNLCCELQEVAEAYPEVPALKSRGRGQEGEVGDWKTWTYAQLHENVQVSIIYT